MALSIPTITLNDGRAMPLLGLGTYKSTEKEAEKAIVTAAKYGYRLIDTASSYKNEDSIGRGIRASGIPRENFFITTKVWNTAQRVGDIEGAFNRSLDRLRLDDVARTRKNPRIRACKIDRRQQLRGAAPYRPL